MAISNTNQSDVSAMRYLTHRSECIFSGVLFWEGIAGETGYFAGNLGVVLEASEDFASGACSINGDRIAGVMGSGPSGSGLG